MLNVAISIKKIDERKLNEICWKYEWPKWEKKKIQKKYVKTGENLGSK